jgi:hypothetical protein
MEESKKGQIMISVMVVLGFFAVGVYFLALRQELPQAHRELVAMIIGTLTAKFGTVCDYWIGTSFNSLSKTNAMNQLISRAFNRSPQPKTSADPKFKSGEPSVM